MARMLEGQFNLREVYMAKTNLQALPSASSLVLVAVFGFVGMMAAIVASIAVVTPIVRGQMNSIALQQQQQVRPAAEFVPQETVQQPAEQTVSSCVGAPAGVSQSGAEENVLAAQPMRQRHHAAHMNMPKEAGSVTSTVNNSNTNNAYTSMVTKTENSNNVVNSNNTKSNSLVKTTNISKSNSYVDSHDKYVAENSFNTDTVKDSYNAEDSHNSLTDDHSTTTTSDTKVVVANNEIASNNELRDDHSQTEITNNTEVNNEVKDSYNTASNNDVSQEFQKSPNENGMAHKEMAPGGMAQPV
jgi:hypothetical protein